MSPIDKISAMKTASEIPSMEASTASAPVRQTQPVTQSTAAEQQLDIEKLSRQIDKINSAIEFQNLRLSFGVEGRVFLLKVIDTTNGEVVKQVPPKEMVDYLNNIDQDVNGMATGVIEPLTYLKRMIV